MSELWSFILFGDIVTCVIMISFILCTYFVVGQLANDYYSVAWGVGRIDLNQMTPLILYEFLVIGWWACTWSQKQPLQFPSSQSLWWLTKPCSMWDGENQLLVSFKSWPFDNLWHEMCKDRFKSPGPHVEVGQPDRHMVMNESEKPLFGKEHVDCKHISQMSMTSWTMPWTEQITALRIGFIFSQDRSMKSPASLYKSKCIN